MQEQIIAELEEDYARSRLEKGKDTPYCIATQYLMIFSERGGEDGLDLLVANPNHHISDESEEEEPPKSEEDENVSLKHTGD
jgi:hypothetical protein